MTLRVHGAQGPTKWGARHPVLQQSDERREIDLCGVPADVDLELVVAEGSRELLVVPLRVAPGQTLDLGQLTVEHDRAAPAVAARR
jgi:hypothetical protein